MDNPNQIQQLEPGENVRLDCAPPCNGAVCIPRARYDDLIRAEMEREVLFHAYQIKDRYNIEHVMDAIFNPKFKYNPEKEGNSKAGDVNAE